MRPRPGSSLARRGCSRRLLQTAQVRHHLGAILPTPWWPMASWPRAAGVPDTDHSLAAALVRRQVALLARVGWRQGCRLVVVRPSPVCAFGSALALIAAATLARHPNWGQSPRQRPRLHLRRRCVAAVNVHTPLISTGGGVWAFRRSAAQSTGDQRLCRWDAPQVH